jgi:hypothetical protein
MWNDKISEKKTQYLVVEEKRMSEGYHYSYLPKKQKF